MTNPASATAEVWPAAPLFPTPLPLLPLPIPPILPPCNLPLAALSLPLRLPFTPLGSVAGAVLGDCVSPGLEVGVARWCAGGGVVVAPAPVLLVLLGGGVMLASPLADVASGGVGVIMVSPGSVAPVVGGVILISPVAVVPGGGVMLASHMGIVCVPPVGGAASLGSSLLGGEGVSGIVSARQAGGVGRFWSPWCVPLPLPLSTTALLLPLYNISALYLPLLIPAFCPGPFGTPAAASTAVMAGSVNGLRLNSLGFASKHVSNPQK